MFLIFTTDNTNILVYFLLFALLSDEPEVFFPKYCQTAILHAAHFWKVVNVFPSGFISDNVTCTYEAESDGHWIMSSKHVSLRVLELPSVSLSYYSMTLIENAVLKLTCNVTVRDTGHPDWADGVTFRWLQHGRELVPGLGE